MAVRPFLDFYRSLGVIPTNQDIRDRDAHFQRRSALYRQLGLTPAAVHDRDVLELGPGSGHNAIFTASLRPRSYTLVDANPASLASTRKLLARYARRTKVALVDRDILDFRSRRGFDLVLCEGVIPTQADPAAFLAHVARQVRRGGVLVITCMDSLSVLAETLRRYLALHIAPAALPSAERISRLVRLFRRDFDALPGMSRRREDWVIDSILHHWSGPLFALDQAIDALAGDFVVVGSSPHFLADWRWYKDVVREEWSSVLPPSESYWANVHSFVDHREVYPPRQRRANARLRRSADRIYASIVALEQRGVPYPPRRLAADLEALVLRFDQPHSRATSALRELAGAMRNWSGTGRLPSLLRFPRLWGRGQQYLSAVRV